MNFQFDSEIAKDHGVNEAIFVHNIFFWINHNEANNRHFHDGKHWTYNTKNAYVKLFPFWTYEQVKKIIRNLVEKEVIITANYNENTWDKTLWYTLTEEVLFYYKNLLNPNKNALLQNHQSNVVKPPIECGNNTNRLLQKQLSYIGTDNKTHIENTDSENSLSFFKNKFEIQYETFCMKYKSKFADFDFFEQILALKLEEEKTPFDGRVLNARIERFAINFLANQNKYNVPVININQNTDVYKKVRM